ncbi:hypothetical protein D0Z03_000133 [Geotrichum reessii]|nr:hypothetical protein D0Z03_000133 [Galactomyces reessii]
MSLYLGLDLSTQQLKGIVVDADLNQVEIANVEFEVDLPEYKTVKGVYSNPETNEVQAPVVMWLDALDLLFERLRAKKSFDFAQIRGVSGACQQHGSVYWNSQAPIALSKLSSGASLRAQLKNSFAWNVSPNWQDASTAKECAQFEAAVGGADQLAAITGSKAHRRFTGPQILRVQHRLPEVFAATDRVALVSSFLASVLAGEYVDIDESDACGMNLWDISKKRLVPEVLALFDDAEKVKRIVGPINQDGKTPVARISQYFVQVYGFSSKCFIVPFTGDNPGTILSLPLKPNDVIVSLGTSTTALVVTHNYVPSSLYHMFAHPVVPSAYMGMLCYCNGSLARERVRDEVNGETASKSWDKFNAIAESYITSSKTLVLDEHKIGFYFPLNEIIPTVDACQVRLTWNSTTTDAKVSTKSNKFSDVTEDVIGILESQALSIRYYLDGMLTSTDRRPRRVYYVGGASQNLTICAAFSRVLVPSAGAYRVADMKDACALGAAAKAVFGDDKNGISWEQFLEKRMPDDRFSRVDNELDTKIDLYGQKALDLFVRSEKESL